MITSLALALVLGQGVVPGLRGSVCHDELGEGNLCGWGYVQTPSVSVPQYAFFEFAPASGAGMGSACACAAVTGAKGEPLTFTRASTATCVKGNPTTGIANGDLVSCAVDQPRVGNPDGQGLKLLVERSAQNVCGRSEELTGGFWVAGTSNPPVVTIDQAISPSGTLTADAVTFTQSPVNESVLYQGTVLGSVSTFSCYVKGNGQSGTIDIGVVPYAQTPCNYNSTSWSRCAHTSAGAITNIYIGCETTSVTNHCTAAPSVFIWGCQAELGTYATSYIPTTSAAVTRAAEGAYIDLGPTAPTAASLSFAATLVKPATSTNGTTVGLYMNPVSIVDVTGKGAELLSVDNSQSMRCQAGNDAAALVATSYVATTAGARRSWCAASGVGTPVNGAVDATSMTASANTSGTFSPARYMHIGGITGYSYQSDSYIGNVCVDPGPQRCR